MGALPVAVTRLDHLVVAATTLDAGRAYIEETLGVAMQPGGHHVNFGTHNMLLGLEDGIYLEVIAIDPEAPDPGHARWYNLDEFRGGPRLTHWACQVGDMGAALARAPEGMGQVSDQRRDDLHWQMASGEAGRLPFEPCFPALIAWGNTPHPSTRLTRTGLRLIGLELRHPQADKLTASLENLVSDQRVNVVDGPAAGLNARFLSASGQELLL